MAAGPEQLHDLVKGCVAFARAILADRGAFPPFAAVMDAEGRVEPRLGWDGAGPPDPQAIYRLLSQGLRDEAASGSILAAALVANVDIPAAYAPPWPDGLRVKLETRGYSRFIYIPYRVERTAEAAPSVEFAEPMALDAMAEMFLA